MGHTYSVPSMNMIQGVVSSITTDTLMGEVSYTPLNWSTVSTFEAIIPASAALKFNQNNVVTVAIKATAVSITSIL